jgi:hypothetical protein
MAYRTVADRRWILDTYEELGAGQRPRYIRERLDLLALPQAD